MSRIRYNFIAVHGPDVANLVKPNTLHMTRIGTSRVQSVRFFDGTLWWSIDPRKSKKPFPALPRCELVKLPEWIRDRIQRKMGRFYLRAVSAQHRIQVGIPYREYSQAEVLAYMVKTNRLFKSWMDDFQREMRGEAPAQMPHPTNEVKTAFIQSVNGRVSLHLVDGTTSGDVSDMITKLDSVNGAAL